MDRPTQAATPLTLPEEEENATDAQQADDIRTENQKPIQNQDERQTQEATNEASNADKRNDILSDDRKKERGELQDRSRPDYIFGDAPGNMGFSASEIAKRALESTAGDINKAREVIIGSMADTSERANALAQLEVQAKISSNDVLSQEDSDTIIQTLRETMPPGNRLDQFVKRVLNARDPDADPRDLEFAQSLLTDIQGEQETKAQEKQNRLDAANKEQADKAKKAEENRKQFLIGKIPDGTSEKFATWVKSLSDQERGELFGEKSTISQRNAKYMAWSDKQDKREPVDINKMGESLDNVVDVASKAREGELSAAQYKESFKYLIDNEQEVKSQINKLTKKKILEMLPAMSAYRAKSEKKGYAVKQFYEAMLMDFRPSNESFGYTYTGPNSLRDALQRDVDAITDESVADYKKQRQEAKQAFENRKAAQKKALENPETLEEFKIFIKRKGKDALTQEQLRQYDDLSADQTATNKQKEKTKEVEAVDIDTTMKMQKTKHTKTGEDLYVVTMQDRVDREKFTELRTKAKSFGGWYSRFNKGGAIPGFQFKNEDDAKSFMSLQEESQTTTVREEKREEAKQDKRVTKLRTLAQSLKTKGEEKLYQDRQTNTGRRAAMAASAAASARKQIAFAETLEKIANAVDQGKAVRLANISAATQLETLLSIQKQAIPNEMLTNAEFDGYGMTARDLVEGTTVDDYIKFVKYPELIVWGDNLQSLGMQMESEKGYKQVGSRLVKQGKKAGAERLTISRKDAEKAIEFIKKTKYYGGGFLPDHMANIKRLESMGIETEEQLRSAIRELDALTVKEQKEDPIQAQERKLVGQKIAGYFPTPKDLVSRMIEQAGPQPGEVILEPSAGKGSIAEVIRAEYPENQLDVVEWNSIK